MAKAVAVAVVVVGAVAVVKKKALRRRMANRPSLRRRFTRK
jgi:hypothetical protein